MDLRELPGGVRLIGVEPARLEAEPAIGGVIENVIGAAAATIGVNHLLAEAAHRLVRRARYRERLIVVRDRMAVRDEARGACTCEDGRVPRTVSLAQNAE